MKDARSGASSADRPASIGSSLDDFDLLSGAADASNASAERIHIAGDDSIDGGSRMESKLGDLRLDGEISTPVREANRFEKLGAVPARSGTAPLPSRLAAFAADWAFVLLLTAAPLLAATAGPARALAPKGLWWTAMFAVYVSFFATIVPLVLFGKTVGMALTGLTARGGLERPALTAVESSRRWIGSLLVAAGLGIPLLFLRDPDFPSPADRLSGRPLSFEEDPRTSAPGVE